jgi:hypothetical protein
MTLHKDMKSIHHTLLVVLVLFIKISLYCTKNVYIIISIGNPAMVS